MDEQDNKSQELRAVLDNIISLSDILTNLLDGVAALQSNLPDWAVMPDVLDTVWGLNAKLWQAKGIMDTLPTQIWHVFQKKYGNLCE